MPIGWLRPSVVPSKLVRVLLDADPAFRHTHIRDAYRAVAGRYRYSIGIVYNTFPWPEATDQQRAGIRFLAQGVLDARAQFPNATLAGLCDVDAMPPKLRSAHRALDDAVDKLYRAAAFNGHRGRAKRLFGRREKLVAPIMATAFHASRPIRRRPTAEAL